MLICDQGVTNIFCGSYGACSLVQTKDGRMLGWGKKTKYLYFIFNNVGVHLEIQR
jgi:hypothetical protein